MILEIHNFNDIDSRKLMDLYHEGIVSNIATNCVNFEEGLKKAEKDFLDYLENKFFKKEGATYFILEEDNRYVSAFRLEKMYDFYLLEALETASDKRKKGYAKKLLREVAEILKLRGSFTIKSNVRKTNIASLNTHKSCSFIVEKDEGMDYMDFKNEVKDSQNTMMLRI